MNAPDISPYRQSNTGTDYVWRFDGARPGPVLMINGLTHGNEVCGAHAVKMLLDSGVRPRDGSVIVSFANPQAYALRSSGTAAAGRYLDQDLNRLWSDAVLAGDRGGAGSRELDRARQLRPFVAEADYLLDIHSMTLPGLSMMLSGMHPRGRALAQALNVTAYIVADDGHRSGTRMRDFGAFSAANSEKTALLIECGQHTDSDSVDTANRAVEAFLAHFGVQPETPYPAKPEQEEVATPLPFVRITETVTAKTANFEYLGAAQGLDVIAQAGTLIARDGDRRVTTPYPDCVALMPGSHPAIGQTAVRLGRMVA